MPDKIDLNKNKIDRTNAILAGLVFFISFIVYAMTVQRSFSFWDCGEFIACAFTLGIPHPPGTPLFVLIGRLFSIIPFVEDISYRINYISVISSAFTAMLSYLLTVKLVGYFFNGDKDLPLNRFIAYIGGIAGGLFVAFSRTNWGNSVEAEVYGMALALSVLMFWLAVRYFEQRGTIEASKIMIFLFYLATVGIGIHMTVFLVVPVCTIFFVLNNKATKTDWIYLCGFAILELFLVLAISLLDIARGHVAFVFVSALLALVLFIKLYNKINWAVLIAIASVATVMESFSTYFYATPAALILILILALLSKKYNFQLHWKTALTIVVVGFIGMSVHLYIPIRSELNPRIDENNPSRDTQTFIDFLDRKQYGQMGMIERMFNRRGSLSNQLGRHPHMGFWSYFEEQYSSTGFSFIFPFFLLGLIGMYVAIKKRLEIGLPFFTLFILTSIGLVLYMNFADGTMYSASTGDAYLEVRNRDYFFTPAFVFFGIAMGLGISAVMQYIKDHFSRSNPSLMKPIVIASAVLVLLPGFALAHNYHACDRSQNFIPRNYAENILDTCEPNAILFTSGDNDTFPVWCLQEVYNYRKDVRVVNLSLLNTDWYTEQMKVRYDVPISLTVDQIRWYPFEGSGMGKRPKKPFYDRARKRQSYLVPSGYQGRILKVQDMMVDEIVIESIIRSDSGADWTFKQPIYFSSQPYAESPLKLRERANSVGLLYKLEPKGLERLIDVDKGYDLYMNQYKFSGYENADVYRDDNATGVFLGVGINAVRIFNELTIIGDDERALKLANKIIDIYPEYWQMYILLADFYAKKGETAQIDTLYTKLNNTLTVFLESNPENLFYMQDLGLAKVELGKIRNDTELVEEGISIIWKAFNANANSNYGFRKLYTVLAQEGRYSELQLAARKFAEYKMNLKDPILQQILGISSAPNRAP